MESRIKIRQAVAKGYIEMESGMVCDVSFPTSKLRRGRVQGEYGSISPTITCGAEICKIDKGETEMGNVSYRIRKLTPNECFILMGMTSADVEKCKRLGVADSELYKQAGNGIVSNCCELLAERLYRNQENNNLVTTDMKYYKKRKELEAEALKTEENE